MDTQCIYEAMAIEKALEPVLPLYDPDGDRAVSEVIADMVTEILAVRAEAVE